MPSTTIHFPPEILSSIDAVASRKGISRNRFVIAACEHALGDDAGMWPDGFFDSDLTEEDRSLLAEATQELEEAIAANRTNRGAPLL